MQCSDDPFDDAHDQQAWAALLAYASLKGTAEVTPRVRVRGFDLGRWVVDFRARYSAGLLPPAQIAAAEALPHWRWGDLRHKDWASFLQALTRFVAHRYAHTRAHSMVPADATYDGYRIGVWAGQQRAAYAVGALTPSRIALLEKVPGWVWSEPDPWDQGLLLLQRRLLASSEATIAEDLVEEGFPLGRWVARLRTAHRSDQLPMDRVRALEELPGWEWQARARQPRWDVGFNSLTQFAIQTGAANPAQHTRLDGYPVGMWVHTQRQRYKSGTMPPEQAQALSDLPGWFWSAHDHAWQQGYAALAQHLGQVDQLPGPGASVDGYPVGQWVSTQQSRYRSGRLAAARVAALEALPQWQWR